MMEIIWSIVFGLFGYYLMGAAVLFILAALYKNEFKPNMISTLIFLMFWPVMWIPYGIKALYKKMKGGKKRR